MHRATGHDFPEELAAQAEAEATTAPTSSVVTEDTFALSEVSLANGHARLHPYLHGTAAEAGLIMSQVGTAPVLRNPSEHSEMNGIHADDTKGMDHRT